MKPVNSTTLSIILLAAITLSGCRKELCYDHDNHAMSVKFQAVASWICEWEDCGIHDWDAEWNPSWSRQYDEFRPEPAEGIRAVVYSGEKTQESNIESEGGRVQMPEGKNSILFYNNDTEYIVFDQVNSYGTATATTRTRTRNGFKELHAGERTITPPDMLYAEYIEEYNAEKTLTPVEVPINMHPLTYSYLVRYRFKSGQKYLLRAQGALAGMAEKVYLYDGHTDATASTILFDCKVDEIGCTAIIKSFGVPDYSPQDGYTSDQSGKRYTLTLEVQLKNGKRLNYEFDVTEDLKAQPRGGIIHVTDIVVSDEDGLEGSGGFDPDVDDWGDEIDIPLPIN